MRKRSRSSPARRWAPKRHKFAVAFIDGAPQALHAISSFIEQILVKDPSCRPKAKELLSDGWCCEAKQATLQGRHARKARKSIVSFAQMSHFSKAALNCMAAQLDTHKIENLADAFASLDLDHDGKLSTSEFADGLAEMGVELEVIHQLVGSIDMDCASWPTREDPAAAERLFFSDGGKLLDEVVFHAFQIFDLNGDGHISLDELRMMLSGQGPLSAVETPDPTQRFASDSTLKRRGRMAGLADDWALLVRVKCLDHLHVQTFEVGANESVMDLKMAIGRSLSLSVQSQRLSLGSKVLEELLSRTRGSIARRSAWVQRASLKMEQAFIHRPGWFADLDHLLGQDHEVAGEVFGDDALQREGFVGLRVEATNMETARGSSQRCELCGKDEGQVDYYGKCGHCGQSGGLRLTCEECSQSFPSSYAKEVHMKFVHPKPRSMSFVPKEPAKPCSEASKVLPDGKTVEQALKDLDTSGDGVVSFDEFKAYLARDAHPEEAVEAGSSVRTHPVVLDGRLEKPFGWGGCKKLFIACVYKT
eukprot:g18528.t1